MNVIPETFMCIKFDIYVFISSFYQCSYQNVFLENKIHSLFNMIDIKYVNFPGKLVTCISYENYVYRTKFDLFLYDWFVLFCICLFLITD